MQILWKILEPPQPLKNWHSYLKTSLEGGCSDIDLSCLSSWCWWWWCDPSPSPAPAPAPVARERRGRERRTRSFIFILESWGETAVTSQYYHSNDVTLSQLSRTSQWARQAHVTTIFYKIKMLLLIVDICRSVWCVGLLAASESLVHMWGMTDRACLHQTSYYHANTTTIAGWLSE